MVGSHLLREKSSLHICEAKEPERIFNFFGYGFQACQWTLNFYGLMLVALHLQCEGWRVRDFWVYPGAPEGDREFGGNPRKPWTAWPFCIFLPSFLNLWIHSFSQKSSLTQNFADWRGARVCSASLQFPDEETPVLWSCDQGGLSGGLTQQSWCVGERWWTLVVTLRKTKWQQPSSVFCKACKWMINNCIIISSVGGAVSRVALLLWIDSVAMWTSVGKVLDSEGSTSDRQGVLLRCRHILCKEHAQQWLGHQVESVKMDDSVLLANQCLKPFHPLLAKNAAIQPLRILHAFSRCVSKSGDPPILQNSMGFYW